MKSDKEVSDLKFEIELTLKTTNTGYSNAVDVVSVKKEVVLNVNTDSPKRKIVGQVEDLVEDTLREAYRSMQDSKKLTDWDIARQKEGEENNG